MIGQATAHRRANAFAQALESRDPEFRGPQETIGLPTQEARAPGQAGAAPTPDGRGTPAARWRAGPDEARMVEVATALAAIPRPELNPETKTDQRARLIAAMEAAVSDGTLDTAGRVPEQRRGPGVNRSASLRRLRPRSRWSRRLAAGGLTVGVAAGAFGGVAAASTNALPGDTLYGLKRGMEDLRLGMANSDADRGTVLLDMASMRLQEARRLMERTRSGPLDAESVQEVRKALTGMHTEAAEGHRLLSDAYRENGSLRPIEALNSFAQSNQTAWSRMRGQLPPQLHRLGAQVNSVFTAIELQVAPLRGMLPGAPDGAGSRGRPRHSTEPDAYGGQSGGTGPAAGPTRLPPYASGGTGSRGGSGSPSADDGQSDVTGLLGGADPLTDPSPGGQASPSGSGPAGQSPEPGLTLPPLLPGLPDVGIGGGQ